MFSFFSLSKKNPCCSNIVRAKNMLWIEDIVKKTATPYFSPILKLT
jgi:hypothetical protein